MITEDYVSFETAKLLKEKGFDEKVISFYPPGDIQRPTLQMAMKWLREVHNIDICVCHSISGVYVATISSFVKNIFNKDIWKDSYEEACEAAIKYCLENLIKLL